MRQLGLRGAVRGKTRRTTISESGGHPASGPGQASVPGVSSQPAVGGRSEYLRTGSGWVYAAFVIDVYSRMIVGWQLAAYRHRCVGGRWGLAMPQAATFVVAPASRSAASWTACTASGTFQRRGSGWVGEYLGPSASGLIRAHQ
jgi:transposase InsO family protein